MASVWTIIGHNLLVIILVDFTVEVSAVTLKLSHVAEQWLNKLNYYNSMLYGWMGFQDILQLEYLANLAEVFLNYFQNSHYFCNLYF